MTAPQQPPSQPVPQPSPALGPADVVLAQLAALQREPYEGEPEPGEGLAAAFAFASPGNREATGPLSRFGRMLRSTAYRGLLGHRAAQLGPVVEEGGAAQVEVLVVTADDRTEGYTWVLGRQRGGPFDACWMTDGVVRHADPDGPR